MRLARMFFIGVPAILCSFLTYLFCGFEKGAIDMALIIFAFVLYFGYIVTIPNKSRGEI